MSSAIIASVTNKFFQRLLPLDIRHSLNGIIPCGFGTTVARDDSLILHYLVVIMQTSFLHVSNGAFNSCRDHFVFHLLPLGALIEHYDIDSLIGVIRDGLHDEILFRFAKLPFEAEVPALEEYPGVAQPGTAHEKLLQRTPAAWRLPNEVAEIVLVLLLLMRHELGDDGGHHSHALVAPAGGADGVLEAAADAGEAR